MTDKVLAALARYDTPTVCNAIETFGIRSRDEGFASSGIRCVFPDLGVMVGYAATATIRGRGTPEHDYGVEPLVAHVVQVPGPRVVVVQDLDDEPGHGSLWGEVSANLFTRLDCLGAVTNGCVRDLKEAHELGFHFFSGSVGVSHANVRVESAGEPVQVGGLTVRPGDIIHADRHGVLVVPAEIAADVPAAADRIIAQEQSLIGWMRSPKFSLEGLADAWRQFSEADTKEAGDVG
ncbi:RraA family protein [Spongiactinospora sp. 9N601]|uniref:RraA family protein n=1 Tax=Spongiactinospora sp. 9N601 TaxID=3375149 RepID=UPI00379D5B3C